MMKKMVVMSVFMILCPALIQADYGIDELLKNPAYYLSHKRFGIICNRASIDAQKRFLPDVLYAWTHQTKQAELTALFSPEHGLFMNHEAAASVDTDTTSQWHCPIYSLHGTTKKPTPEMLKNIDVLIFDLPDIGIRCFTYISTLKLVLEAAAENNITLIVLDRPNPLAFWGRNGPMLEKGYESFVGALYVPFLHGMTIGQLAQFCNKEIGASLSVLGDCADLAYPKESFIAPSPNLMSIEHLYAYAITVFLEGTNYSEGRGTMLPFLQIGAPWVNADQLALQLNDYHWTGIAFEPVTFVPVSLPGIADHPKHENEVCHGVRLHLINPEHCDPMVIAYELLKTLFTLYPSKSELILWDDTRYNIDIKVGNTSWRNKILHHIKQGNLVSPLVKDL